MAETIYPDAPRVGVGAVVVHQDRVLLALRGKAPAQNLWAIPGGSLRLGETLQAAAEREIMEETGLQVKAGEVIYTFDVIMRDEAGRVQYHYVILDLLAEPLYPEQPPVAADDALDVRWFTLAEVEQPDLPIVDKTRQLVRQVLQHAST